MKFGQINGYFDCSYNNLVSLLGAPHTVGGFYASNNCLEDLNDLPAILQGDLFVDSNRISRLGSCLPQINGDFDCSYNLLTSLLFCPQIVSGNFICAFNRIENFEFCPTHVGGKFNCQGNLELGHLQMVSDFAVIKAEHQKIEDIKQERDNLNNQIVSTNLPSRLSKI